MRSPLPRTIDAMQETLLNVHAGLEGLIMFGRRSFGDPQEELVYATAVLLQPLAEQVGAVLGTLGDIQVVGFEISDEEQDDTGHNHSEAHKSEPA